MKPTIIGLLGKPLAGKDTIASHIERTFPHVSIISMGDVMREVQATGPEHRFWHILQEAADVADQGGIAPDEPVFRVFTQLVEEKRREGSDTIVWVGALRREPQIDLLDAWCKEHGYRERFINVEVPDREIWNRREIRMTNGRKDDQEEAFALRLQVFAEESQPVLHRLRDEQRLMDIDGLGDPNEVGRRVVDALIRTGLDPEIRLPSMARR